MAERSGKGIILAAIVWIIIIGILAVAAKFFILPHFKKELEDQTGSESIYRHEVVLAADSFSGYSVFRSPVFKNDLKKQGIKLIVQDDGADYEARIRDLDRGQVQMAVFTIDSLVTSSEKLGRFPATIVMVIDETSGADAMISYKSAVASIQDLDSPDARIVLTPKSPSEFLARTVIAHFNLPGLPEKWWIDANGAEDVYRQFISADRNALRAYTLWEPFVSRALQEPDAHLLLDSSKLKGYIVDVLVAERSFLKDHPDLVKTVVESYFRSAYSYSKKTDGMVTLVMEDAAGSDALTQDQAEKLVTGIEWKNTMENYLYFNLQPMDAKADQQYIEDIVENIIEVLIKTGAMDNDPLGGKTSNLYYDRILRDMLANGFHPGKTLDVIEGLGPGSNDLEQAHTSAPLRALSDQEWAGLVPVGSLRIEPISFARGTARINLQSDRDLQGLAGKLRAWPSYYLKVIGHARAEGDADANMQLAEERAAAAAARLIEAGVDPVRVKSVAAVPEKQNGSAQSVSFVLGQLPY
ncbi:OmpA family protein [bacterium]|nr:OmpA family protein [candidate division CSSED10-310 bacterium]